MHSQKIQTVLAYHETTKHHLHRYAKSLGYLDWANQPIPFRTYEGVTPLLLPLLKTDPNGMGADLYERKNNLLWDFSLESIAGFLELSMGLSAWKQTESSRWALRMNPSSGNLHPTELHVVTPSFKHLPGGVYHYHSYLHALEPRISLADNFSKRLQNHFQSSGFLVGLTSIYWREAWKYGERAFRYSQHDIGHALAALSFSANLFGWRFTYLNALASYDLSTILGLRKTSWHPDEEEVPELLAWVSPGVGPARSRTLPTDLLNAFSTLPVEGTPTPLSQTRVSWQVIRDVHETTQKERTPECSIQLETHTSPPIGHSLKSAAHLIRQRRSAVAFDGKTFLSKAQFIQILYRTLPHSKQAPFDAELSSPRVDLILFVHRVGGMEPGVYCLVREPGHLEELKKQCSKTFLWKQVEDTGLPLYLLKTGFHMKEAAQISCHQAIASDSAFSLGMLCRFQPELQNEPWRYREFFWECGQIGQVLYLEAEAAGVRGTGIGCFFDNEMHALLGLESHAYQSLYHFTVGGPVEDPRVTTQAPYFHLPKDRWATRFPKLQ